MPKDRDHLDDWTNVIQAATICWRKQKSQIVKLRAPISHPESFDEVLISMEEVDGQIICYLDYKIKCSVCQATYGNSKFCPVCKYCESCD